MADGTRGGDGHAAMPARSPVAVLRGGTGLAVRFWGVRGSIPCGGRDVMRYGGNSSCVELMCGTRRLILDAGTGLRYLGEALMAEGRQDLDIFLSHAHLDHLFGIPFFRPLFEAGNKVRIWSGHLEGGLKTEDAVRAMMAPPLFPITPDAFAAELEFRDFRAGDTLEPFPDVAIATAPLQHHNGATGYRICHGGRSIAYVTDTEHEGEALDERILALVKGADLMIYDATYTDEEYPKYRGWGHSTWQVGVRLAKEAGVKRIAAFHHDPLHDDGFLDRMGRQMRAAFKGAFVAREGLLVEV